MFKSLCWTALVSVVLVACSKPPPPEAPPPPPPQAPKVVDADGDSVPDPEDRCPDKKEDGLAPEARDGCPTADPDQDGIVGEADRCPDKPETRNDYQDDDGCPDTPPPPKPKATQRVGTAVDKIEIKEEIRFDTGKATVEEKSVELVHSIAGELKMHPDIDFIDIVGHADKRGNAKQNITLTQQRAEAVMKLLVDAGVNPRRLRATGFGALCPIDPADNEEAYTKNRRVEFHILRRGGEDLKEYWKGCELATKESISIKPVPDTAPRSGKEPPPKEVTLLEGRLLLPKDILFVKSKTEIQTQSEPTLAQLAAYLKQNAQLTKVRIEGHASPGKPPKDPEKFRKYEADGLTLSRGRSRVVVDWLVKNGIDAKRLVPVGCADHRPVFRGKQVEAERSRRTELHVIETSGKPEIGVPSIPSDCQE